MKSFLELCLQIYCNILFCVLDSLCSIWATCLPLTGKSFCTKNFTGHRWRLALHFYQCLSLVPQYHNFMEKKCHEKNTFSCANLHPA